MGPDGPSTGAGGSRDARDELEEARARGGERGGDSAATSGYRAVAPDMKSSFDAAERRRQMIQESKFLGGDMEHTHLVKGLDFALLQKVRSEITNREKEEQEEALIEINEEQERKLKEEESARKGGGKKTDEKEKEKIVEVDPVVELQATCRTNMAKSLVR